MKLFNLRRFGLAGSAALASAMLAPGAGAVNLATDGIGEVAIAPYYTARDGWVTTINLINTQDVPIIVKVRIHEGRNSRDVLDFNVALSAFDVFPGLIREAADGSGPVFVATDSEDELGRTTCTIPNSVASGAEIPLSPLAFGPEGTRNDDGGPTGTQASAGNPLGNTPESRERMREGYIEFIVMGYAEGKDEGIGGGSLTAVGDAIESHNCSVLQQAFNTNNIAATATQFGEPLNALKFNFALFHPQRGVEAGNTATTWANFYNPLGDSETGDPASLAGIVTPGDNAGCAINRGEERRSLNDWKPNGDNSSCQNLITAQVPFDFLEPSLNDAYPQVANWWDDSENFPAYARPTTPIADFGGTVGVEDVRGVDAVSLTIQRSDIVNEWSNNPNLGVTTDWIVTMPTKGFYVDGGAGVGDLGPGEQSAIIPHDIADLPFHNRAETVLDTSLPYAPFAHNFGQTSGGDRDTATACNEVSLAVFDRAEQRTHEEEADEVIVSPAPPPVVEAVNLCFETNVVTWNNQSALNSIYPILDEHGNPTTVQTSGLLPPPGNTTGWMFMQLDTEDVAGLDAEQTAGPFGELSGEARGLPVIGFMLKQRNFGDVTRNFASSTDHAYMRRFELID